MTELSPNKQALLKIRELKQQIAELQQQQTAVSEPVAIVSMACRFPRRSSTPEAFWQSLMEQRDEVTEIPEDRWDHDAFHDDDPEVPGKMYARHGVFLDNLDKMDPEFFGISPREATWVDPQQRLLMEVGWEALERASWIPENIGKETGIFVGWMHNDYQNEASDSFLNLNPYIATGAAGSFLCGRLAYYLGLEGPSVAVDTACSSSLVALHLACQSLQQRDCDRALVGGVNAICSPTTNILTCKLKALSPSGHSRAFDAAADGYLRGEGCGVVTLRRLADAEHDGDPILGVISGSAIGHNGFSSGLTAPNPKAQEKVIRQALERAELSPDDVSYLEAHGTGTELGDPIEMRAAMSALAGQRSKDEPLLVGSVKTNIGHLEAAAGMAGLIKVLLSLQKNQIPGQLNFENPNPHIPWETAPVKVLTEPASWPNPEQQVAGVSAFGMSGTNAHVIVSRHSSTNASPRNTNRNGQFDATKTNGQGTTSDQATASHLITLSGKTDEAVRELAEKYARHFEDEPSISLADVALTSNVGRSHFEQRAALVASDRTRAIEELKTLSRGGQSESSFRGNGRRSPKVAWQFTGQGSQYVGMSQQLFDNEPVFRDAVKTCDTLLSEWRGESLIDVMFTHEDKLHHTAWTQPAIFAVQMGLVQLLESKGFWPDLVWGHSVGQYAAACVAGIMSWEDGLKLISERGRLIGELPAGGKMLAVFAPLSDVENTLETSSHQKTVSIAALNGTHIVLSGKEDAIADVEQQFSERNIRCKQLKTSHAFHSALMTPVLEPFQQFAAKVNFRTTQLPLICNVSGKLLESERVLDGFYWAQHIREAVRFSECIDTAQENGCELILELGPQAVLTRMAAANWKHPADTLVSCLQHDVDDSEAILRSFGRLYVHGVQPDFNAMHAGRNGRHVLLPTYPFQRRRFWGPDKPRAAHAEYHTAHPLLGGKVSLAGATNESRFESFIEPDSPPWLPDHEVMGQVVVPGAAFVEMALAAANDSRIEEIVFEQPLRPTSRTSLQTIIRSEGDQKTIETYSAAVGNGEWSRNFTAKIVQAKTDSLPIIDLNDLKTTCDQVVAPQEFYQKMQDIGLNYGPKFQTISSLRYSQNAVLSHLETNGDIRGFRIAPPLLDGALHSLAVGLLQEDDEHLFLPVGIDGFQCYADVDQDVWCHAVWQENEGKVRIANLTLFAESGDVIAQIDGLKVQQISRAALRQMSGNGAERLLYDLQWQSFRLPAATTTEKKWLVIGPEDNSLGDAITHQLNDKRHRVERVLLAEKEAFDRSSEAGVSTIDGKDSSHWNQLFEQLSTEEHDYVPDGIVWLFTGWNGDSRSTQTNCQGMLNLVHTMHDRKIRDIECGLQLVTENAIAFGDSLNCDAHQSKYWGLGRVIGAEHPELRCRLIDVTAEDTPAASTMAVVEILLTPTRDSQLAIRDSELFVPRMKQIGRKQKRSESELIKPGVSYLITGGLGMLGRQAAKWLADNGATQVVLVSRRAPDDPTREFLDSVENVGCEVVIHSADLGSRQDVEKLFGQFGKNLNTLAGVVHAAGILDDASIADQNWERFERVLAPKISGATLLDEFTRELPLDFFVLYSSVASVLGSPGQSNYAAGNAFLDGLAWQRRSAGLPACSINWGPWTEGMADDERIRKRLALQGITPLGVDEAHAAMEQILTNQSTQATVIDVDWRRMQMGLGGESPAMLEGLAPSRSKSCAGDSAFVGQLKRLRGNAQTELIIKTIQELLQGILSTPDTPETDRPLIEMGLDSLMAVEFSTQLQMMLGDQFTVGPTMLFDHPTIDAISAHVLEMLDDDEADVAKPATETSTPAVGSPTLKEREPVAIVGMSCRFPGARNLDEFWQNLLDGVDSVCEIPEDRWDVDRFYDANREPGKMYAREGGFIDDIADFDAEFFNIPEQEACWIDPQHRMLLENSYRALEHAGISPHPLVDANVGVFMGIMGQDYAFLPRLDDEEIIRGFEGAGLSHSAGVGRISYMFGFEGPSIAVDTASSSSLVALHQAVRSLQDGNCNMALAGGVNAILAPVNSLLMSKAGLLSPDGRCQSFSANANGFGRGEGCGVVVLKRLSDAQQDEDRIMAVVRGGAVVHNGFTGGITSPSGKAQARVISEALQDAKISPSQVQYLEAHGTGTEFGDPMELGAAASIYGKGRKRDAPLLVGSVKANISHLEAAGGISGLIKTVLSLHNGVIPQQAHFEEPSPHIPWKRLPIKVVDENTAWPETGERIAGVTALGLVGTNAHCIISAAPTTEDTDEKPSPDAQSADRSSELLVLSARSHSALADVARDYARHLGQHPEIRLRDFCHTAAVGRRHYEQRCGMTVNSREDAIAKLQSITSDSPSRSVSIGKRTAQPKIIWAFTKASACHTDRAIRELFAAEPEFRLLVSEFDERLAAYFDNNGRPAFQIQEWLSNEKQDGSGFAELHPDVCLFVLQSGLAHVLKLWGVDADMVVGFGVGQYTAACVAGGLCFKDALTLVVEREATLEKINASGDDEAAASKFEKFADQMNYYPPNIELVCSQSGEVVPVHRSLGGSYWRQHLNDTISEKCLPTLLAAGSNFFLEIGPEISSDVRDAVQTSGKTTFLSTAVQGEVLSNTLLSSLGRLYAGGVDPDFAVFGKHRGHQRVSLPHYPFRKKRYWITEVQQFMNSTSAESTMNETTSVGEEIS